MRLLGERASSRRVTHLDVPRGRLRLFGVTSLLGLVPSLALACALPPSVILTLPTGYLNLAAALTVLISGLALAWLGTAPLAAPEPRADLGAEKAGWAEGFRWVFAASGFLIFAAMILAGSHGDRDPMHNLMTLGFWVSLWILVPLLSLLLGDVWALVSPWLLPLRLLGRRFRREGGFGLARFGALPACLAFAGFSWFQMVSLSPDDPAVLATLALGYFAVILLIALFEGQDWLKRGEFLTLFFGLIARLSPFWIESEGGRLRVHLAWPGARLLKSGPLLPSEILFVTMVLAALTFDGVKETFWWQGMIGENPLEPTGRSAVVLANSLGLLGTWIATMLTLWLAWRAMAKIAGGAVEAGPLALSFLAIAAGYHLSHYLVMLLTGGQYLLEVVNDPLHRGWSLLGLPEHFVSYGFLSTATGMTTIYALQFAWVLGAHLLALFLSLRLAGRGVSAAAHLPMTLLMVVYTLLGLWLLSTARSG